MQRLRRHYSPEETTLAAWRITVLEAGPLFLHVDPCEDDNNKIYSDVAYFVSGVEWVEWRPHGAKKYTRVK